MAATGVSRRERKRPLPPPAHRKDARFPGARGLPRSTLAGHPRSDGNRRRGCAEGDRRGVESRRSRARRRRAVQVRDRGSGALPRQGSIETAKTIKSFLCHDGRHLLVFTSIPLFRAFSRSIRTFLLTVGVLGARIIRHPGRVPAMRFHPSAPDLSPHRRLRPARRRGENGAAFADSREAKPRRNRIGKRGPQGDRKMQ